MDCAERDFKCASLQGAGVAEPEPNFTPLQCLRSLDFWLLVFACIIGAPGLWPVRMLMDLTASSQEHVASTILLLFDLLIRYSWQLFYHTQMRNGYK